MMDVAREDPRPSLDLYPPNQIHRPWVRSTRAEFAATPRSLTTGSAFLA